jgi:hypothetical protein
VDSRPKPERSSAARALASRHSRVQKKNSQPKKSSAKKIGARYQCIGDAKKMKNFRRFALVASGQST